VHQAGHEPLEQLPLAEDEDSFVADAGRQVAGAVGGLAGADEAGQEEGALREEPASGREQGGKAEGARGGGYELRALLSSALIAGTISWRSPITA
jgi:hypothetical protein